MKHLSFLNKVFYRYYLKMIVKSKNLRILKMLPLNLIFKSFIDHFKIIARTKLLDDYLMGLIIPGL